MKMRSPTAVTLLPCYRGWPSYKIHSNYNDGDGNPICQIRSDHKKIVLELRSNHVLCFLYNYYRCLYYFEGNTICERKKNENALMSRRHRTVGC